jgi:DNA processing protein
MKDDSITCIEQKDFASHPLLARLLELHDIPKQIYIRGTLPDVHLDEYGRLTPRILTVVGSRKNTSYGRHALEMLISSLQGYNVIILSGLALGIDGLAHITALNNTLTTIAVPGSGLDMSVLYPATHKNLAQDIVSRGGALISELEPTTQPAPWTFPQRNRIMACLSDALLIIEAEEKSGTLITARQALELGRDIGAVPGEIFSPTSAGPNMLIHEGAYSIASQENLLALLHLSPQKSEEATASLFSSVQLTENEKLIISILREPTDKDSLFQKTSLSFPDFLTAFSSLEINGYIEESFGEVRRIV